eukprot:765512-Hanusia_phi.AAC.2
MGSRLKGNSLCLGRVLLMSLLFWSSMQLVGSRKASKSESHVKRGGREARAKFEEECSNSLDAVDLVEQELYGEVGAKQGAAEQKHGGEVSCRKDKGESRSRGRERETEKSERRRSNNRNKSDNLESSASGNGSQEQRLEKFLMGEEVDPYADLPSASADLPSSEVDTNDISSTVIATSEAESGEGRGQGGGASGVSMMSEGASKEEEEEEEKEDEEGEEEGRKRSGGHARGKEDVIEADNSEIEKDLMSRLERFSHQQALPAGFGDPEFVAPPDMLDVSQQPESAVFVCKGKVEERKIEPDIMSKSQALVYEAAEQLGERYVKDATLLARLPYRRKEDGSIPEYLEQNKENAFLTWLYGGIVANNSKTLENLQEYVGGGARLPAGLEAGTTEASQIMNMRERERLAIARNVSLEEGGWSSKSRALSWEEAKQERALQRVQDKEEEATTSDPEAGRIADQPPLDPEETELVMINKVGVGVEPV